MDSNNNINEQWIDQQQWPPDAPSANEAWSNMQTKLDEEMPVYDNVEKSGKQSLLQERKLYVILLLLFLFNINHFNDGIRSKYASAATGKYFSKNTSNNNQSQTLINNQSFIKIQATTTAGYISVSVNRVSQIHKTSRQNSAARASIINQKVSNTSTENKTSFQDTTATAAEQELAQLYDKKQEAQSLKSADKRLFDSLQNDEQKDENKQLLVQAGLQWTMPLPIAGSQNYFVGSQGTQQPWRVLLPSAWVSVTADKNMLMAEVNPFASASFNPKLFYNTQIVDSAATLEKYKAITKVFGISGAINFQHNFAGNWWAGGGLQTSFWAKGVAVLVENKHDITTNTNTSSKQLYMLSKEDWQYFSKFQLYPHVQLMYRGNRYQAGLRAGATFTSLAKDKGAKNLVFTEAFFRLPLISNKK